MNMLSRLTGFFRKDEDGKAGHADKSALQKNMEKALEMKKKAGPQAHVPDHQTSHEGGVGGGQVNRTDTSVGSEPTYTPNLKRSRVGRSGDT